MEYNSDSRDSMCDLDRYKNSFVPEGYLVEVLDDSVDELEDHATDGSSVSLDFSFVSLVHDLIWKYDMVTPNN